MIKIGDFSKFGRVTVKTLRYYDELGLLKPVEVDPFTGYRYYAASQLARLNRILALKELGLSLDQIAVLLSGEVTPAQLRAMLNERKAEIARQMAREQERLALVEARLAQIETEGKMSEMEVVVKKVPAVKVASVRGLIPTYAQQEILWRTLEGHLHLHAVKPVGPCFTLYHNSEYTERDVDAEACEPVDRDVPETSKIKCRVLPEVESMACGIHRGAFNGLAKAYADMLAWIERNGYRITSADREVYLYTGKGGVTRQDDPSYVTEIQIPVEKIG